MKFILKFNNSELQLPVSPSDFTISNSNNNTVVNVNDLGDVNLLGKSSLQEISISCFFPNQNYYFCDTKPDKPFNYVKKIKQWFESNLVGQLIITDTNINLTCSIESFEYGEDDGTKDVKYTISFKQYRKVPKTKVNIRKSQSQNRQTSQAKATQNRTYTVKKGDCLSMIAKKETGSSNNWRTIYNDNKGVIGGNPNLIFPGQQLTLRASY